MRLEEVKEIVKKQVNYHAQGFNDYPLYRCWQDNTKFLVQLELLGGFYSFVVDPKKEISYNGLISIGEDFRGHGLGRLLVETREAICNDLEANLVVINHDGNQSFWDHLGYNPLALLKGERARKIRSLGIFCWDPCFKYV